MTGTGAGYDLRFNLQPFINQHQRLPRFRDEMDRETFPKQSLHYGVLSGGALGPMSCCGLPTGLFILPSTQNR